MFELWYTLILIILLSIILIKEWIEIEIAIFATLILLILGGVISIEEAFNGFSNVGMLTIALLFILGGAIYSTGALSRVSDRLFGDQSKSGKRVLARIVLPVSFISAFLNNTPVVALFLPVIRNWSEKHGQSLSKLLIPLSFAAILGGMCTLIGTSTNLIIHGLLIDHGLSGLDFFEITKIGLPVSIIGLLYLIFIAYRYLPDRREPIIELGANTREFVIALKVESDYPHLNKSIEEAGLRHLTGLFLFQIERNDKIIAPAGPGERIEVNDRLFFTGLPKTILELQKTPGLQLVKDAEFNLKQYDASKLSTYEVVVSQGSPLIGRNIRESNFREKYNAVIIAIHRHGERIRKKIGDIVINPGDTLLILADRSFQKKWYHTNDFYLISLSDAIPSKNNWQVNLSLTVMLAMIALTISGLVSLIAAASLAVLTLIVFKCITTGEARRYVDFRVLIIIASAFGIATAMENSGLASLIADYLLQYGSYFGIVGVLGLLYLISSIYTMIIINNAAAPLLFPVAFTVATTLQLNPLPFVMTVLVAAAASFATPISYQTNLMVYGPGGYKFIDFLKIGLPLQILVGIMAVTLIYYFYF